MTVQTLVQAVNSALREEMRRNDDVVILGEDVGRNGGVFRATEGLYSEFGESRVIDTPLSESGIIGVSIGLALYGLRPVAEIQFADFIFPGFDQIVSELSKIRYRSGGDYSAPVVLRVPYGGGIKGGIYHSQSIETFLTHIPGLKVVVPSRPSDARGLLISSLRDPNPVIFLEPKRLYRSIKEDTADEAVPIGQARVVRQGDDVTILSYGAMVQTAIEASKTLGEEGTSTDVIDLRTLVPLDVGAVLSSARKTGRVVIVHEAPRIMGYGAELAALIAEEAMDCMKAPIVRVAGFDSPFPYVHENLYLPTEQRIVSAVRTVMR